MSPKHAIQSKLNYPSFHILEQASNVYSIVLASSFAMPETFGFSKTGRFIALSRLWTNARAVLLLQSRLLFAGQILFFSIVALPSISLGKACEDAFFTQAAATQKLVNSDAYDQWQIWERLANIPTNRALNARVSIPTTTVPSTLVDIQSIGEISPTLRAFFDNQTVLWPRHPFNRAKSEVPFHDLPASGTLEGGVTASRSLTLELGSSARYTIKLSTDTVQERNPGYEPGKLRTEYDIAAAIARAQFIKQRDQRLGAPEGFVILHDVLTVADKRTGRGYLIRDISLLNDGHYYLPAFAIPVVGRDIAKHNGQEFDGFWLKHYAVPIGKLKADLLLRYGLQMETPNAQNFLIQLDRNLRPTGLIVVRDIADSIFVDVFARGLGIDDIVNRDFSNGRSIDFQVTPYWENSFQHFDKMLGYFDKEYQELLVPQIMIQRWARAHNLAFANRMNQKLPSLTKKSRLEMGELDKEADEIYRALKTKEGQEALERLR